MSNMAIYMPTAMYNCKTIWIVKAIMYSGNAIIALAIDLAYTEIVSFSMKSTFEPKSMFEKYLESQFHTCNALRISFSLITL